MLKRVLDLLGEQGWFDLSRPYEKTINFTQGACLWMLLTRAGVAQLHVKFSDRISLELEASRCAAASRLYPSLVPAFVGYSGAREDGLQVLVSRAVEFCSLSARALRRRAVRERVFADWSGYFGVMRQARLEPELAPLPNEALGQTLRGYFDAHPLHALARRELDGNVERCIAALPPMPQHGDLVLNNLGRTLDGAALIIDWEDFGVCGLPGLDLFTLELSLAGDAARLLAARQQSAGPVRQFARTACAQMQIDFDEYERLALVYALIFRYLKRNYGPGVRARLDQVLVELEQGLAPARRSRTA